MDLYIYFILWAVIQHHDIYFAVQIAPELITGVLEVGFCVLLTCPHPFKFFESLPRFLAPWGTLGVSMCFLYPRPRISHVSKHCIYQGVVFRSQDWGAQCAQCYCSIPVSRSLSRSSQEIHVC
jgi:hypothetical protein